MNSRTMTLVFSALLIGLGLGWFLFTPHAGGGSASEEGGAKEPLYWVAPMDSNYRRDEPGKSPMGMDLVPVYEDETDNASIKISPVVVNNLGVRTGKASMRRLHSVIRTVGYVKYDEDKLVHIHPRVEGWIEQLYVKASGEPVEQGRPLYALYSPQLVNAQEEYLSALLRGNRDLIAAAESRLRSLQLSNEFIQRLRKNRTVQQTVTFEAPQTGVVDNLEVREGFFVKPGTTLMSVGSLDEVWVEAEVFERQAALVKNGLPVQMSLDFLPGKTWKGEVDYVYPTLDAKTRTVRVRLRFANPDQSLKPNMFAQVQIVADSREKVLTVPRPALIRTGDSNRVVLSLGEGRFKSVTVTTGSMDEEFVQVLSGLEEGDRVVTSAQFLIDSESSKSSDFKRISSAREHSGDMDMEETQISMDAGNSQQAVTIGLVNKVAVEKRSVNITRGAIEKWGRPEATLDFRVPQSIEIDQFVEGQKIRFRFAVHQGDFSVIELFPAEMKGEVQDD